MSGKPCPNCGHVRSARDDGPRAHCPNCRNEYPELLPPLKPAYEAKSDASLYGLVAANLVTIGLTFRYQFDLDELMLIYWVQSVAIGVSFFVRMSLAVRRPGPLGDFSDASERGFMLMFFPLHYGFFHVLYLVFLKPAFPGWFSPLLLCGLAFILCHAYSLGHNLRRDRVAGAHFSTLFWLPYARVVPMHFTIIFGKQIGAERGLLLFLVLKTFADLVMHAVEHHVLRRGEPAQH